jgi:hypothetical protein
VSPAHPAARPARRSFECRDVTEPPLPRGFDLVVARDMMQHLPFNASKAFLSNVKASGAAFLLATSFPDWGQANYDIKVGEVGGRTAACPWRRCAGAGAGAGRQEGGAAGPATDKCWAAGSIAGAG